MPICKITLRPFSQNSRRPDYSDTGLKKLFGTLAVNPELLFTRKEFFVESPGKVTGMSISGMQQKLSLKYNPSTKNLDITDVGGEFILKPSPEQFPFAAENEHCAMIISEELGIPTALCGLVRFKDGELAYITRRFDRIPTGKLPQEDLLQLMDSPSEGKYGASYEEAGAVLFNAVGERPAVVLDFVNRILFAYLIGNNDMHLKNFSVTKNAGSRSLLYDRLTPHYDCLFTQAFPGAFAFRSLALDMFKAEDDGVYTPEYESRGYYSGSDFIRLGEKLNLRREAILQKIKAFETAMPRILALISNSFMPTEMKILALAIVEDRIRAISQL